MDPKVIFFDCWYTLFYGEFAELLRWLAGALGVDYNREFIKSYELVFMTSAEPDLRLPALEFMEEFGADSVTAQSLAEELVGRMEANLTRAAAYEDTFGGLTRLHSRYRLGLITNIIPVYFEEMRRRFEFDNYFDFLLPTYQIGTIKPDPAVFARAIEWAGVEPAAAMMVGDNLDDDVRPALAAGMEAVLLDRRGRYPDHPGRITTMAELEEILG